MPMTKNSKTEALRKEMKAKGLKLPHGYKVLVRKKTKPKK
jgi:hypothetical protein